MDAENVYKFVLKKVKKEENIILFGRSLGSGPASYLASKFSPKLLILMSPFSIIQWHHNETQIDSMDNISKFL
jgi:hypothetical protein